MMRFVTMLCALALTLGLSSRARAQAPDSARLGPRRELAEKRFREGVARVVQRRLGLTDEQLATLQAVSRRRAAERQELFGRERTARAALRREILAVEGGDSAGQRRVASLLDELLQLQRRRVELVAAEQRELADFLTPVQRARYLELQEQARRRIERATSERRDSRRRGPGWHRQR